MAALKSDRYPRVSAKLADLADKRGKNSQRAGAHPRNPRFHETWAVK